MHIDPKVETWLRKLLDGVENSNNAAEVVATAAYNAMRADEVAAAAVATLQEDFRKCLCEISFTRAGWDVRQMPSAQKSKEAASGDDYMTRARQIWADNPDKRASLRGVFEDVNPLMTMREIERTKTSEGKMT